MVATTVSSRSDALIETLLQDSRLNLSEPVGFFSADFLNPIWPEGLQVSTYLWLQTHRAEQFFDQSGTTIANSATVMGRLDVVSSILGAFPDEADKQDKRGLTPLAHAARMGHAEIVGYLLASDFQINVNSSDEHGITPLLHALRHDAELHLAIRANDIQLVKEILNHIDNSTCPTVKRNTTLHTAAISGCSELIDLLLSRSEISINARNQEGAAPLHFAAFVGHIDVIRALLNHPEIDINARAVNTATPLMLAAQQGHTAIVRLFLERPGIAVNLKFHELGDTALLLAVRKQRLGVVQLLVGHCDTDDHALNHESFTPYTLAWAIGSREIRDLLRSRMSLWTSLYEKLVMEWYGPRVSGLSYHIEYPRLVHRLTTSGIESSSIGFDQ